jgi:cobalt-zinc-cadmium efflux system outer membrane protein
MSVYWFTYLHHERMRLLQAVAVLLTTISCSSAIAGLHLPELESSGRASSVSVAQTDTAIRSSSDAGRKRELTLETALAAALEANPELLAARQELIVARAQITKARYWNPFNPHIGAGAGQRHFDQGGTEVQPEAELGLEVEIAGQRSKRIEEAEQALARAQAEVDNFERLLRGRVTEAFYKSLYARRRLGLFKKTSELNTRLRNATTLRFRSGEVAKLDENLAVIRDGRSRRDVFQADRDYRHALLELERLMGSEPTARVEPQGGLEMEPAAFDPAALVATALEIRPDLMAHHAEIRRVEAEQELTRRSRVPNLTLGAFYEEEVEAGGERDRIVGGRVNFALPVFDRKQAELSALSGRHAQAEFNRRAALLAIRTEVDKAYRAYESAVNALALYETEALALIDESFRFIETAYREGKIGLLELVVVQNDLVEAEFSYIETLWDYWRASIALERAVGRPLSRPQLTSITQ